MPRMEGRFGFIQSEMELKVLILYLLRALPEAATWEELKRLDFRRV